MKKLNFTIISILITYQTFSQLPTWTKTYGGKNDEINQKIITDKQSNIYIVGQFEDAVDFDPGSGVSMLVSKGDKDGFITKLDSNGNLMWVKSFGSTSEDMCYRVDIDQFNNVIVGGFFNGTVDFDPNAGINNLTSIGFSDAFFLKLDPNGKLLWVNAIQGISGYEYIYTIKTDFADNIYIGGFYSSKTIDMDPSAANYTLTKSIGTKGESMLGKYDKNGLFKWAIPIGNENTDFVNDITIDKNNALIITGNYMNEIDLNPDIIDTNIVNSKGGYNAYLAKYDLNGKLIWTSSIGGDTVNARTILTDMNSNIYLTGTFKNSIESNNNTTIKNSSNLDMFISKFDHLGKLKWTKTAGSNTDDYIVHATIDPSQYIYLSGRFDNKVDFDYGNEVFELSSNGSSDAFIQKIDTNGKLIWVKGFGGLGFDVGSTVSISTNSNIFVAGRFNNSVDFDYSSKMNNISSLGGSDAFILKINQCLGSSLDNNIIKVNDSIIANQVGDSYQWLDCDNNMSIIPNATSKSFKPISSNGNYSCEIISGNCIINTKCFSSTSSLNENKNLNIEIFPNPTNQFINIKSNDKIKSIRVIDILGREVLTKSIYNLNSTTIDLSNWPNSTYYIQIENEKLEKNTKMILKIN